MQYYKLLLLFSPRNELLNDCVDKDIFKRMIWVDLGRFMFILSIIKSKVNYSMTFKVNDTSSSSWTITQATGHHLKPPKFNVGSTWRTLFDVVHYYHDIKSFYERFIERISMIRPPGNSEKPFFLGDPLSDLNGGVGKLIYLSIIVFFSLSYVV